MTIFDAYNHLLLFFAKHDLFVLDDNYKDLLIVTDYTEIENKQILSAALEMMAADAIVKPTSKKSWVLIKKLEHFEQNVKINGMLAIAIANLINNYCEAAKDETNRANILSITERDIANLVVIASPKEKVE